MKGDSHDIFIEQVKIKENHEYSLALFKTCYGSVE